MPGRRVLQQNLPFPHLSRQNDASFRSKVSLNGSMLEMRKSHGIYTMLKMIYYQLQACTKTGLKTDTGELFSTFSIVTTEANDLMAEIHNSGKRMPVILDKSSENRWIDISILQSMRLLNCMAPSPAEILKAHTISPLINYTNG